MRKYIHFSSYILKYVSEISETNDQISTIFQLSPIVRNKLFNVLLVCWFDCVQELPDLLGLFVSSLFVAVDLPMFVCLPTCMPLCLSYRVICGRRTLHRQYFLSVFKNIYRASDTRVYKCLYLHTDKCSTHRCNSSSCF